MMDSVSKLKHDRFLLLTVMIACVVCPGFVFLFVFQHDVFITLDFLKLLMLALSPGAPVFLFNLIPSYLYVQLQPRGPVPESLIASLADDLPNREQVMEQHRAEGRRRDRETMNMAMVVAAVLSIGPLYLPAATHFFTTLSVHGAVAVLIVAEILTFAGACVLGMWPVVRPHRTPMPDVERVPAAAASLGAPG